MKFTQLSFLLITLITLSLSTAAWSQQSGEEFFGDSATMEMIAPVNLKAGTPLTASVSVACEAVMTITHIGSGQSVNIPEPSNGGSTTMEVNIDDYFDSKLESRAFEIKEAFSGEIVGASPFIDFDPLYLEAEFDPWETDIPAGAKIILNSTKRGGGSISGDLTGEIGPFDPVPPSIPTLLVILEKDIEAEKDIIVFNMSFNAVIYKITIIDRPPVLNSVVIGVKVNDIAEPSATAYTNSVLGIVSIDATDDITPNNSLRKIYQWQKNGVDIPGAIDATLDGTKFKKGDNISLQLILQDDSRNLSEAKLSNTITIAARPSSAEVKVVPERGSIGTQVRINGSNFLKSREVDIAFGNIIDKITVTNYSGSFVLDILLNKVLPDGENSVKASDGKSEATTTFFYEDTTGPLIKSVTEDSQNKTKRTGDVIIITVEQVYDFDLAAEAHFNLGNIKDEPLYNDGTHGDTKADDTTWTRAYEVASQDAADGKPVVAILVDNKGNASTKESLTLAKIISTFTVSGTFNKFAIDKAEGLEVIVVNQRTKQEKRALIKAGEYSVIFSNFNSSAGQAGDIITLTIKRRGVDAPENLVGQVQYILTGEEVESAKANIDIMLSNRPPIASPGGPYTGEEGGAITFDASKSSDPDGDPLQYRWDWDNDGKFDTEFSSSPQAIFTWGDEVLSQTVFLEVTDGLLTHKAQTIVTIENVIPEVIIEKLSLEEPIKEGVIVSFVGKFTDPGKFDTHTIGWDFGDGGKVSGTLTPKHKYEDNGEYTVTLTVQDNSNGKGKDSLPPLTIENVPPVAKTTGPYQTLKGVPIILRGIAEDMGEDTFTFRWDFNNDKKFDDAEGQNPIFEKVSAPGIFPIFLQVIDDDGGVSSPIRTEIRVLGIAVKVIAKPKRLLADGKSVSILTATVKDDNGQPITDEKVEIIVDAVPVTPVTDKGDGTYTANYTAETPQGTTKERPVNIIAKITMANLESPPFELILMPQLRVHAGIQYEAFEDEPLILDGSKSSGLIVAYNWDLNNDGKFDDATGVNPSFTFTKDGAFPIKLKVTDVNGVSKEASATVNVKPVNDRPKIEPPIVPISTNEDSPITVNLTSHKWDEEDDTVSLTWQVELEDDSLFTVKIAEDLLTITPMPNQFGEATITLILKDSGGLTATQEVPVTISPQNDAPEITPSVVPLSTNEDSSIVIGLTSHKWDEEDDTISLTWQVEGGDDSLFTAQIVEDILTITPMPNQSGQATITLILRDSGGLTATQEVPVTISPINDPPKIKPPVPNISIEQEYSIDLRGHKFDIDNNPQELTWEVVNKSEAIFTADIEDNTLTIHPKQGQFGEGELTLILRDSVGESVSQDVKITILGQPSLELKVTPDTLTADGKSQAQIIVTLTRTSGEPITDDEVKLKIMDAPTPSGILSAVINQRDGAYTATYTASTKIGVVQLTAQSVHFNIQSEPKNITLLPGEVVRLIISPDEVAEMKKGDTQQFKVSSEDLYENSTPLKNTDVNWTVADINIGEVDSKGLFTATGFGETTINVTLKESPSISVEANVKVPDTEPPEVLSEQLFPELENQNVPVTSNIKIAFSEIISLESVENNGVRIIGQNNREIEGMFEDIADVGLIFNPVEPFKDEETVTVIITTAVEDLAGNKLITEFRLKFTTGIGIWPGDANNDGQVDILDIVPLGRYWEKTGSNRDESISNWEIQPAVPWQPDRMATYADTNGDGKVNAEDISPVAVNWMLSHSPNQLAPSQMASEKNVLDNPKLLNIYESMYDVLATAPFETEGLRALKSALGKLIANIKRQLTPYESKLLQNYPNPSNPETWIPYQLAAGTFVRINIYDISGRLVRTLEIGRKTAGYYFSKERGAYWDGRNHIGERVASGVYFYQLQAGNFKMIKKLIHTK